MLHLRLWPVLIPLILFFSGIILISVSPIFLKFIIRTNMVLTPGSRIYDLWQHFPELIPTDFYFFNWTNPEDIYTEGIKPKLDEVGPYRFMVDFQKENITWNDNGTVTYQPVKYWYFNKEGSKGDVLDNISCLNPLPVSAAHVARTWNYMVRKGLSFSLSGLSQTINITRTVEELLFKGFPDPLIKIAKSFPFFAKTEIPPWEKFAWFYERNGSSSFDGIYNMGTGIMNSVFGQINTWNYLKNSPYFEDTCSDIHSSAGEKFDPEGLGEFVSIFSAELCRSVSFQYEGEAEVDGIIGRKYILGDYMLDNGTKYPETKCSCSGDCLPSGVFNVSRCRYGSPAFASLPHFYKADPYYNNLIEGLQPDENKHTFYIIIEPNTGIPLKMKGRLQMNLWLHSVPSISMFDSVPTIFFPVLWFEQSVDLPANELSMLKLLLNVTFVCSIVGGLMIMVALSLSAYFIIRKGNRCYYIREEQISLRRKSQAAEMAEEKPEEKRLLQ